MKLQVLLNGQWHYVFCRNERKPDPVTTKDRRKALHAQALAYFQAKFSEHVFRCHA